MGEHVYTRKSKVLITIGVTLLLLIVLAVIYYLYWLYNPYVIFDNGRSTSSPDYAEDYYKEIIMVVTHGRTNIPTAKSVNDKLNVIWEWNDAAITELRGYGAPMNIKVSGGEEHGKTTLRYEGYVTTPEGETIDYKNEKTFDFIVSGNAEFFDERTH